MRVFFFLLMSALSLSVLATDPKYPVSQIPPEMKQSTYGVVREQVREIKILARNKMSFYEKEVITILNSNGADLSEKEVGYSPFEKIQFIRGAIYDADGKIVKRLKTSDIADRSSFDGFTLYSDNRIKSVDLTHTAYPYTIEFEYEVDVKYLYSFPTFSLIEDDEVAIQKSSYSILYLPNLKPRYKTFSAPSPTVSTVDNYEKLSWTFENIVPNRWEIFSPDSRAFVPTILSAPTEFDYDGFVGRMDSWKNYGLWRLKLLEGRDILPEATRVKVKQITAGKSDLEKVKTLYEFMQNKTRYVNIVEGIGGLQPIEAKVVDEVGYGDCKALSNYMVALLKEAGIKGYYTPVMAGNFAREVIVDFPAHQSNHIIVSVPIGKDTVWLECTDQNVPFNYLGRFTGDRHALMVTEEGGVLVKTPRYSENTDIATRSALVKLDLSGKATAQIRSIFSGARFDDERVGHYVTESFDKQKQWLQKTLPISSFNITSSSFRKEKKNSDKATSAVVEATLSIPMLGAVNGKRIFLTPNLLNRSNYIPEKITSRKTNVRIPYPFTDVDSIVYELPEQLYPEFLPEPVKIESRFGSYESKFVIDQGNLKYTRKLTRKRGEYPPETYQEFVDFYKAINKADNVKIVFLNKT